MATVTVAIPFYNPGDFFRQAIESVVNQTYTDWQLFLVDDASTDNSLRVAEEYAKKDARIRVFSDGENRKLPYRLNQIAQLCDTTYLARMDGDDIMHPQRLEKQIEFLLKNPKTDVLGTNAYSIDRENKVSGVRYFPKKNENISVDQFIHPTIMAKTEWFRANPYDEKANRLEDFELWLRTSKKYNFRMLCEPLLFYREFPDNYYKKYIKSYPASFYILKKHKKWILLKEIFTIPIRVLVYFFSEKILKSDVMFRRRNAFKFCDKKTVNNFFNQKF